MPAKYPLGMHKMNVTNVFLNSNVHAFSLRTTCVLLLLLLEVSCLLWSVGVYCVMKSVLPVSLMYWMLW